MKGRLSVRLLSAAVIGASLLSGAAYAADMAVKASPPPPPVFNWAGFYVGGNLGYSFGQSSNRWDIFAPAALGGIGTTCPPGGGAFCASGVDTSKLDGFIGGFQAGYNWRTASKYLFGLEADFQFSGQKRDQVFTAINATNAVFGGVPVTGTVSAPYSEKLTWLSTVRG